MIRGYGTGSSSVANNLLPVASTVQSGDGVLSATTTTTYDSVGTVRTVDGPLAGTADTTRYRYDIGRQLRGQVGPDPDGAGPLGFRAIRTSYNLDGQPTQVEKGYVNGQSDGDWLAFVSLQASVNEYDANGRKSAEKLVSGGVTHALTQYSYDLRNRIECTAVRMNPALFASPPSSACALGTQGVGANDHGPDRIAKNLYVGRQLQKIQSALGTGLQQDTRSMTYTQNGQLYTLTDAKSNRTTYEYDGFDRLKKTRYPSPSAVNTSSTTDYEELDYDATSNVISKRLRDGQTIYFTPDNLNRTTLKNLPGSELDVSYTYDHANRMLSASTSASVLQWDFDALGRLVESETSSLGAVRYLYDAAGRRERLTWPDGLWVKYEYDVANALTAVREYGAMSGAGVLATFTYDNLGQRKTLTRGNGTSTSYDYDGASRLSLLAHDVGDSGDTSSSFTYSPSSQLRTLTRSNSNYNWTATNTSQSYVPDGLNRYSSVGGVSLGYDGRGNLTSHSGSTYAYSAENRLLSAAGTTAATLSYDSNGRLSQLTGSASTRFLYDGSALIAEYDGSNVLQRRYVHGSGVDEPLVWYEGSGTTGRRWLNADERGSVIAVTNGSGTTLAVNSYDEYGKPGPNNLGRFQYTGQAWMPSLQLYHYKARVYSAELGRFLQTDPMGYADDFNLYAYVKNDPLNHTDPTGAFADVLVDIGFIAYSAYELATNPSWTNAGALGADIVGAAVPFATGLGAGVRGAANAADAARAANTARGRASETRKLAEIDATKNTTKTATSTGDRIRDGTKADGTHVEVKDAKRLDATQQMRGLDEAAGKEGKRLEVYTGENTKVSGNVNQQTLPNTDVIKCSDLGPKCR